MSQEKRFSDEFLNAFVDDQIAAEEKSRAYIEIHQSEDLNRQVCELRKLHDLVQLAYREPPAPPVRATSGPNSHRARLRFGVAASFLLTLGIVLGSQIRITDHGSTTQSALVSAPVTPKAVSHASSGHSGQRAKPAKTKNVVAADLKQIAVAPKPNLQQVSAVTAAMAPAESAPIAPRTEVSASDRTKVLIHLANDDNERLAQALEDIEGVLRHYRNIQMNAHVEVVVNGKGLELVRIDTSAFAERIQNLQREYSNLTFAACQNTIDRLVLEKGIRVRLLPGVITIDSGMAEIMRRQNQGWAYIQV